MWHWSADTLFWQLSIDHNMDVHYQVKHRLYMPWTPSWWCLVFTRKSCPLSSQSERTHYYSHIKMFEEFYNCNKKFSAVYCTPEKNLFDDKAPSAWLSRFVRSSMCPLSFFPRPTDSTRCENSTGCIGTKNIVIMLNANCKTENFKQIFLECYCVARKTPIKKQEAMVINLWFCSLLLHPYLNISGVVCKSDSNEMTSIKSPSMSWPAWLSDAQDMKYTHTPPTGQ